MSTTRQEAIQYVREHTCRGWLSRDAVDDGDMDAALRVLLGPARPAGYMSDASGWRVHPERETFEENEAALADRIAQEHE